MNNLVKTLYLELGIIHTNNPIKFSAEALLDILSNCWSDIDTNHIGVTVKQVKEFLNKYRI